MTVKATAPTWQHPSAELFSGHLHTDFCHCKHEGHFFVKWRWSGIVFKKLSVHWQLHIILLPLCKPQFQRNYCNGDRFKLAHPNDTCTHFFLGKLFRLSLSNNILDSCLIRFLVISTILTLGSFQGHHGCMKTRKGHLGSCPSPILRT